MLINLVADGRILQRGASKIEVYENLFDKRLANKYLSVLPIVKEQKRKASLFGN